jgi:hypothetical protein
MTNSYNTTSDNTSDNIQQVETIPADREMFFYDKERLNNWVDENGNPATPSVVQGSRIWFWNKNTQEWDLQHVVILGDETIKQGPQGDVGKSAYQSYLDTTEDFPKLSEKDWIESLQGKDGEDGRDGIDGSDGSDGETGGDGQGSQGPKGDTGDAVCDNVDHAPNTGERGKLYIDSVNQIIVTLG